jgi:hypothetical protein
MENIYTKPNHSIENISTSYTVASAIIKSKELQLFASFVTVTIFGLVFYGIDVLVNKGSAITQY